MGNPLDFITRRKEMVTQTPGEPVIPVVETLPSQTPSKEGAIYFNRPNVRSIATSQAVSSETKPAAKEDTIETRIDAFSQTMGIELSPSLKKAA
jgi:hypothetical protein